MKAAKKRWDRWKPSLLSHGQTPRGLDPCAFVLVQQNKVRGLLGVPVDDLLGGRKEIFDRTVLEIMPEFDSERRFINLSERRTRRSDATVQGMLNLNKMVRSAKTVQYKQKVRSVPVHKLKFIEVHDEAQRRAPQGAHVILAVHKNMKKT